MLPHTALCRLAMLAALTCAAATAGAQQQPVREVSAPLAANPSAQAQFRHRLQTLHNIQAHNRYLETLIADQQKARAAQREASANLATVKQGIVPLLFRMIDDLEAFIRLDLPFLPEERNQRIAALRAMMQSADVALAEKYRLIVEAYQVELGFGREVAAYAGWLETSNGRREVDFLRVGRLVLAYQSRDRDETGFWNAQGSPPGWQSLGDAYTGEVARGLRLAFRQAAPDWLTLPVPAPVTVAPR